MERESTQELPPKAVAETIGRYEIIRPLATGGMAKLFLARARGIEGFEKHVVIKTIRPEFGSHEMFIDMLLDEARLAATLDHHNIAQVYDVGRDDDGYYLAMEYLRGHDAREILRQAQATGRKIPHGCALAIVSGLAAGLGYAHQLSDADGSPMHIVHRDVSPGNAFVTYDGGVKLVDFGIARATSRTSNTRPGMQKGKVSYMSPEQCAGRDLDHRTDIFSLGIVLYELTTVRAMYPRGKLGDYDFMKQIVDCRFKKPSELVEGYPPKLEAIVLKALARNPDDRYQSALDLAHDLEEFARRERLPMSASSLSAFVNGLMANANDRADTIQEPTIHSVVDMSIAAFASARGQAVFAAAPAGESPAPPPSPRTVELPGLPDRDRAQTKREGAELLRAETKTGVWRLQPEAGKASSPRPWHRLGQVARSGAFAAASAALVTALGFAVMAGDDPSLRAADRERAIAMVPAQECPAPGADAGPAVMSNQVAEALAPTVELAGVGHCGIADTRSRRGSRRADGRRVARTTKRNAASTTAAAAAREPAPAQKDDAVLQLASAEPAAPLEEVAPANAPSPASIGSRDDTRASTRVARNEEPAVADDAEDDDNPRLRLPRKTAIVASLDGSLTLGRKSNRVVVLVGSGQPLPEGTRLVGDARRRSNGNVAVRFRKAVLPDGNELAIAADSRHEVQADELLAAADVEPASPATRIGRRLNAPGASAAAIDGTVFAVPGAGDASAESPLGAPAPTRAGDATVELADETSLRVVLRETLTLPE